LCRRVSHPVRRCGIDAKVTHSLTLPCPAFQSINAQRFNHDALDNDMRWGWVSKVLYVRCGEDSFQCSLHSIHCIQYYLVQFMPSCRHAFCIQYIRLYTLMQLSPLLRRASHVRVSRRAADTPCGEGSHSSLNSVVSNLPVYRLRSWTDCHPFSHAGTGT
jgi:hypothetical protein